MFVRGVLVAVLTAAVSLGAGLGAGVAFAHDPIFLADSQTSPDAGPLLVDGTISFAVYGTLLVPGDTRGLRVQLAEGDTLDVSLLIPALEPEQSRADVAQPMLAVVRPDGSPEYLRPTEHVRFDEPFSGTSYVRLLEFSEPAQAGVYRLTVSGNLPSRFTVAVGTNEQFGTPVENAIDRDQGSQGVQRWYATAPPLVASPAPNSVGSTTLPPATVAPSSTVVAATSTSGPLVSAVPQTGNVDGAAGSAVFIGVMAVVLGGVGFLVWSKRRNA